MPDFNPSFGDDGTRRAPTVSERSNGFPCGAADQHLFNYLQNLVEGQVESVAINAGVASGADGDKTVLLRAIQALIDAAVGGGDTSNFILMSQARNTFLVYPEVLTADGILEISTPATGTIRVPGGVTLLHRGVYRFSTAQEDFVTNASRTYHLRWRSATELFTLEDLTDVGYNPGSLADIDAVFDSDYDDILVARVITNSSNVASVTNLTNMNRLFISARAWLSVGNPGDPDGAVGTYSSEFNSARTPQVLVSLNNFAQNGQINDIDLYMPLPAVTRYGLNGTVQMDFMVNGNVDYIAFA